MLYQNAWFMAHTLAGGLGVSGSPRDYLPAVLVLVAAALVARVYVKLTRL